MILRYLFHNIYTIYSRHKAIKLINNPDNLFELTPIVNNLIVQTKRKKKYTRLQQQYQVFEEHDVAIDKSAVKML